MKGLSAFLVMRRSKDWDYDISSCHQIPWNTECLTSPWTPSVGVESQLQANALSKCQFVVDIYICFRGDSVAKNLPAKQETWVQPLGWEDPLEKEMITHFGILAWRIPGMESLGVGYSPWGHRESDMTEQLKNSSNACICMYLYSFSKIPFHYNL